MVDIINQEKELHLMRAVWPRLRYIEYRYVYMLDHGPLHADRVKRIATQISYLLGLSSLERSFLRAAAIVHDIGMSEVKKDEKEDEMRATHQNKIEDILRSLVDKGDLKLNRRQIDLIVKIAKKHTKPYDSTAELPFSNGTKIRVGLLRAILRIADAMDMDQRRTTNFDKKRFLIEQVRPDQMKYHESANAINGVRIICEGNSPSIQVFTENPKLAQLHISELSREIMETPMYWPVSIYHLKELKDYQYYKIPGHIKKALICAYCNPHSIIMAALSKKNLFRRGIESDICCSYEKTGNVNLFWQNYFPKLKDKKYDLFIFAGLPIPLEDPDRTISELKPLIQDGKEIYYCHYLEKNFEALQDFLKNGIKVSLGDSWSAFSAEIPTLEDLYWAKIAALITRDRGLLSILKQKEEQLLKGILYVFHKAIEGGNREEIELMIEKTCDNDIDFFVGEGKNWDDLASSYIEKIEKLIKVNRRVLFIESAQELGLKARNIYPILDEIMMKYGATGLGKNIILKYPYIIAKFKRSDEQIRVLFQSCWREEGLIPIKFLCRVGEDVLIPGDHIVWISFKSDTEAQKIIDNTIERINSENSLLDKG